MVLTTSIALRRRGAPGEVCTVSVDQRGHCVIVCVEEFPWREEQPERPPA